MVEKTREMEWYVPRFGPRRFRLFVGLTFYPYSLMNACYVLIGSLLSTPVHYGRMLAMVIVYLLAVGVAAHSLDAMSPNRPWGDFLSRRQLSLLAVTALIPSLGLGLFLAFTFALFLLPVGLLELFFLLAYNLELFEGRFHTDFWFALSWGFLPVLAGFMVQTGVISVAALAAGLFGFFTAFVEINASRPYKALKREPSGASNAIATRLESILKGVVATVYATAALLLILAVLG